MAFVGVAILVVLGLNLNLKGRSHSAPTGTGETEGKIAASDKAASAPGATDEATAGKPAGFREYPIGEDVIRNEIRIAAVWLPPVQMDGMPGMSSDVIHLEADIHATEGNRNGFAKDEFVPYLKVTYEIRRAGDTSGTPIASGPLMPMVARDGLHYGANVAMPKAGTYALKYHIEPPSAGGLGRHADAATGVDPWWKPFDVSFDWDYEGPPKPAA
jgi:uncharacterized protein involved in high-affinity Fe2+ transport